MSVDALTFGCRLNAYESEVIKAEADKAGLDDVLVVNTCAVTAEAVRQARQAIRRARREAPGRRIVVTGCAAQIAPQLFSRMPEVDLVLGNADKLAAESYRPLAFGVAPADKVHVTDIGEVRETASHLVEGFEGRARAFVEVQNGCDHRCTFCIIPYGRGPSRSVPMGVVVEQIKKLVGNGYGEIVLTGVDITAYGADLPGRPTLGKLVQAILRHVPDLPRLRLSSLDSVEVDEPLVEALGAEKRLMPHLHLSLQAGDDLILKRMKRRHSRAQALEMADRLRAVRPDVVFGADFIAGFPTETEDMFARTLSLVEEAGLTFLHVFPFSPRPGTPAARMPQIAPKIARQRAARLRALGAERLAAHCAGRVGSVESVLVEREGLGRTEQFLPIRLSGRAAGEIVPARVSGAGPDGLVGEAMELAA